VTYEFSCQSIENNVTERMVYRMFFLGHNFVLGLLCTLKAKKNLKTKNLSEKEDQNP